MEFFRLVEAVLDKLRRQITDDDEELRVLIDAELIRLSRYYANLAQERPDADPPRYNSPEGRFAYIHSYTTCHADFIRQILHENRDIFSPLLEQKWINITCIGGGPGSEILGFLKYLMDLEGDVDKFPRLKFNLFDKEASWGDVWNNLESYAGDLVPEELIFSTNFQQTDVTDKKAWENKESFLESDIFTMSYFLSEVNKLRDESEPFFDHLFSSAKPNSLFLFIDNNSEEFYSWFDSLADKHNLEVLVSYERREVISPDEEKRNLGKYYDGFRHPKVQASVAVRICRKRE